MAEEGNTAQRVVVSALRRRSTGVNNRQVVTSGVEFDRLFNVAVVCNARELVCSSVSPVCFDFPLSCRLKKRGHMARSGHKSTARSINNCFERMLLTA